jgi:hypothetical protein
MVDLDRRRVSRRNIADIQSMAARGRDMTHIHLLATQ